MRRFCIMLTFWVTPSSRDSNPGQFFGVLVFVSAISSSNKTTLILALFCHPYIPSYRYYPLRDANSGYFFEVLTFWYLFLLSRHKCANFGANWFICSRTKANTRTHTDSQFQLYTLSTWAPSVLLQSNWTDACVCCVKTYHGLDHSMRITEYLSRKLILKPQSSLVFEESSRFIAHFFFEISPKQCCSCCCWRHCIVRSFRSVGVTTRDLLNEFSWNLLSTSCHWGLLLTVYFDFL